MLISNVVCSNSELSSCLILSGIPGHRIEDIQLNDICIQHHGGGTSEDITLQPLEAENKYPEPNMFGRMLFHGVFIRHAWNILLNNVEILSLKEDLRPAFLVQDDQGTKFPSSCSVRAG